VRIRSRKESSAGGGKKSGPDKKYNVRKVGGGGGGGAGGSEDLGCGRDPSAEAAHLRVGVKIATVTDSSCQRGLTLRKRKKYRALEQGKGKKAQGKEEKNIFN